MFEFILASALALGAGSPHPHWPTGVAEPDAQQGSRCVSIETDEFVFAGTPRYNSIVSSVQGLRGRTQVARGAVASMDSSRPAAIRVTTTQKDCSGRGQRGKAGYSVNNEPYQPDPNFPPLVGEVIDDPWLNGLPGSYTGMSFSWCHSPTIVYRLEIQRFSDGQWRAVKSIGEVVTHCDATPP